MITFSLPIRRPAVPLLAVALSVGVRAAPSAQNPPSTPHDQRAAKRSDTGHHEPRLLATPSVLWHRVLDGDNSRIGSVTDILIEMQSGRIAYFAVTPSELFERPRVLPADALEVAGSGALKLKGSLDTWYEAPILSANRREVDAVTQNGLELRGYYESRWAPPLPHGGGSVAIIGRPAPSRPPTAYVSLRDLQNTPVLDEARQQIGIIDEFLIDWPQRRLTHAIVSQQEPSLNGTVSSGFAVPLSLLAPPSGGHEIVASVPPQMLQQAPRLANAAQALQSPTRVFRYVAPSAVASNSQ